MHCGPIEVPDELVQAIRAGRFVVFAGAGVSMREPANLPSFWRLAEQIAAGSGRAPRDDEPLDSFLGQLHHQGMAVHQRAANLLARPDLAATPLHCDLLRLFPSPAHVRLVTTNFDLLFQQAAQAIWDAVPEVFRAPALPLGRDFRGIVQVHGALTAVQDLVLTDSDFGRAYLTEGWARRFLVEMFRHFSVLFVGYSHTDTVMRYVARALPAQEGGRRYALDRTACDPQFWRLLGIQPILFPQRHPGDYGALYAGVQHLAQHVQRGILDWQRELTALAARQPPADAASMGLIEHGLQEVATTRFFVQAARAREWIAWLEKRGVLEALFDHPTLSEQGQVLAGWLAEQYALQYPSELFVLIGRHHLRVNATFWRALARAVSRSASPVNAEVFARWVSLLLATAPQHADPYPLSWLAERGAELGDLQSVLQVFAHMAAWQLEVKPGFSWESEADAQPTVRMEMPLHTEYWLLHHVWDTSLRPSLQTVAAPVLSIVVAHLEHRYATQSLWQQAGREWDHDSYRRATIEPHEQNRHPQALDVLIDAARDALEWLMQQDATLGSAWCERLIRAEAPLLRRLAIHGMIAYAALSWDEKLRWLLSRTELQALPLHHEIFQLLRCAYPHAQTATQQQLIASILAFQWPNHDDPEKALRTARTQYDWLWWLHDADPACALAAAPLQALCQQYPHWQPSAYPDLTHWSSGVSRIALSSPWSAEELLAKPAKDWAEALREFQGTDIFEPSRSGLLDVVSQVAKQCFVWGDELAETLAAGHQWHSDVWEAVLRAWAAWEMAETEAQRVCTWLQRHELYAAHARVIAEALWNLVRDGGQPYAPGLIPTANAIARTLWTALERSAPEAATRSDWLQQAINHPAGMLAEFWLGSLALWWHQHREDAAGPLSEEYRQALTAIVDEDSLAGGLGRTVLASQLGFLLALDEQWTTRHLVPLFRAGDDARFQQAWDGFLAGGGLTPQTVAVLTPAFFDALRRLETALTEQRDRFIEYYTTSAGFFAESPLEDWMPQFFSVATPQDRQGFARHMEYLLHGLDEARQQEWWHRWLRQYWTNRIEGVPVPLEPVEVQRMLDWVPRLPAVFPEAVRLAVRMPQARLEYSHLAYTLKDSPLVQQYPDEMAQLMIFVLSCEAPAYSWLGLDELAGRLTHLPVQAALRRTLMERMAGRGFDISIFGGTAGESTNN